MHFCPACHRVYQQHVEFCSSDGEATRWVHAADDPMVGVVFDERYELMRQIGAGGNGVVYLARQLELNRLVAFKMMYAERMNEPRALKRFAREARALAALDHPGCVRVHDFRAPDDSVPYLVMDLIEGHPLGDVITKGGVPPRHAVLTAMKIAEAVDAAHRAGIVHRDLKPENVILDVKDGELRVRLIDFGLAIVVEEDDEGSRLTRQGRVVGTPDYMSPEQVRGADADGRSDLYSLGVILYELLEGVPPFHASTPSATAAMHIEDEPPPLTLTSLDDPLRERVTAIVMRLLAKRPEERPRDGEEVAATLGALHADLPDVGPAAALLDVVTEVDSFSDTGSLGSITDSGDFLRSLSPKSKDKGGGKGRAAAIAVGAVLLLGGAIAVPAALLSGGDEPAPEASAPGGAPVEGAEGERAEGEPGPDGRLEVDPLPPAAEGEGLPTTGLPTAGTVEMPGGDAQEDYEAVLRALSAALSAEGLRPRDIRSSPRGARAWAAQGQEARTQNYAGAMEHLGELRAEANSRTAREWMVYRLQAVERRLGDPPPRAMAPRLRALWGSLDGSAATPNGVRRFMQRIDELERAAR